MASTSPFSFPFPFLPTKPTTSPNPNPNPNPNLSIPSNSKPPNIDLTMTQSPSGVYTHTPPKVSLLWDLDNKPPQGPPFPAAKSLLRFASLFGTLASASAFANRHAFLHVPAWVAHRRREERHLETLERRGEVVPDEPYVCGVCGRKCRTRVELRKHFRALHERERAKKVARMRALKGKKRKKYKERFIEGNVKYEEAARELLRPKTGYGLAAELRRAGVYVRMVEDKPQAADAALKRQMQHSMSSGVDWLVLVSDDSDFSEMIWKAREADLKTAVVGDWRNALGRRADVWVPWVKVENGEVGEEILGSNGWNAAKEGLFSVTDDDDLYCGGRDLDGVVNEIVDDKKGFRRRVGISEFSEEDGSLAGLNDDDFRLYGSALPGDDMLWDSEDEDEYFQ